MRKFFLVFAILGLGTQLLPAQEATAGIDLRATLTGEGFYSNPWHRTG